MKNPNKYINFYQRNIRFSFIILFISVIVLGTFSSCVDEDLTLEENTGNNPGKDFDGDVLSFSIKLDSDITSRAMIETNYNESLENYIDTQNKFRILFFDKDGYFLFDAIDRTVTPMGDNNYYVRIPFNYIIDRTGHAFDVDEIKRKLRNEKFKISVLANWPNNSIIHPSDFDDSDETGEGGGADRPIQQETVIKGEPNWGWAESVLNPQASTNKKHISDLHHLVVDGNYNSHDNTSKRPTRLEVYDFVMGGNVDEEKGTMGVKTDWVKSRVINENGGWKHPAGKEISGSYTEFSTRDIAESWIRENWNPNGYLNDNAGIYRHYSNLWNLWDFQASYLYGTNQGNIYEQEKWSSEWYYRNGHDLAVWLHTYYPLENFDFTNSTSTTNEAEAEFKFTKGTQAAYSYYNNQYQILGGIYLPKDGGVISFKANASGQLRIRFASSINRSTTTIFVQKGKPSDDEGDSSTTFSSSKTSPDTEEWQQNLTGKSQEFTIYCDSDTPAIIYSIEFIQEKYLYDTDREGILPSEDYPIPMYGVQEFDPASDWEEGSTKDLSASTTDPVTGIISPGKSISLIRSLAKVVVLLPQKATHVYLRSANRTARCEPIDVETPTNELWKEHNKTAGCEWFNIIDYGFCYNKDEKDEGNKNFINNYVNWLSWFYGAWRYNPDGTEKSLQWDFDSHDIKEQKKGINATVDGFDDKTKFPRLFYPDINRSDYCAFRYVGQGADGLYKYVLYVPEKSIDDPNNVGKRGAQPKVAHIEFRLEGENENSLDDNDCHRIYFTNYSGDTEQFGEVNSDILDIPADQFDYYEKNELVTGKNKDNNKTETSKGHDFLKKHWPIMRNHVYEFTITGSESLRQNFQVKVANWGYQPVDVDW